MDPRRNPYNPGAGLRPAALAGRDEDIEAFEILADRARAGLVSRSIVFSGLRGVGKTVLLAELAGRAMEKRWLVVQVEAEHTQPGHFGAALAVELANAARRQRSWLARASEKVREALGSITSFQAAVGATGVSLGFERLPGRADSGRIQFDLVDLAETVGAAAKEEGIGVAVLIDEMQDLTTEQMSAVCRSCHRAGQSALPWFVVGGGLPNLPTRLAEAESYAERLFDYRLVDRLAETDALLALAGPAAAQHVRWERDAAQFVLDESRGYPYFLQQFGKTVWDAAAGPDAITLEDATIGVAEGQQQLDLGFYSSRWERATKAERELLAAMAPDDGRPSRIAEVTERLGKSSSRSIGPARASLIAKGIVFAPEHGMLAYTVPGMADFVRRSSAE
ncbi:MAG: ATP-binding protein [Acidimicrobiales bacterium]